jgi:hypothetical protein
VRAIRIGQTNKRRGSKRQGNARQDDDDPECVA